MEIIIRMVKKPGDKKFNAYTAGAYLEFCRGGFLATGWRGHDFL